MNDSYELLHSDIFNYPIIRTKCTNIDYQSSSIEDGLNNIFNGNRVIKWSTSLTTCSIPSSLQDLLSMESMAPLINWIKQSILTTSLYFDVPNPQSVKFIRGWTNRSFEGNQNNCHLHSSLAHGVAVFYQRVPEPDASQLVLIKNGGSEIPLSYYPESDCFYIKVKSGDLIIHHPKIPHAISLHKNPNPRTCLVFDFVMY